MKKIIVLFLVVVGTSLLWAQKVPAPKNFSRIFHLRQPRVTVPEWNITIPVHASPFKTNVSVPDLSDALQRAVAPSQVQEMSTVARFHKEGNMEFWRPPEDKPAKATVPAKRSRESLELEAMKYDLPADQAAKMSREELQEWLGTYLSFRNITKGVTSRREQPQDLPVTNFRRRADVVAGNREQAHAAQKWAESQPDYFEENYVTEFKQQYDEDYKKFVIPDGAPYKDKPLHILVVNDLGREQRKLISGLAENEITNVSVGWVASGEKAKEVLLKHPELVDVILLDLALGDPARAGESMLKIPMYVYNHHLNIPVISYSSESSADGWLLSYNIVGQYPPVAEDFDIPELIAYLKNIVYTGRARPQ